MIYLKLFLHFFKIGAVSFGGGYGMLPLMRETVLDNGWLTESQFLSFIAVSESTPGPLAVNMATFIGASQGGIAGSLLATLGVIMPSFFIILVIAALIQNLLKYEGVKAFLSGIRPCIAALILTAAVTMGFRIFFGITDIRNRMSADYRTITVFLLLLLAGFASKKKRGKKLTPVAILALSAVFGIVLQLIFSYS